MRTTINLDSEAHHFASIYADAKGITLSAAISELIRRAEQASEPEADKSSRLQMGPHGFLIIAGVGKPITPEMVKEASEDAIL